MRSTPSLPVSFKAHRPLDWGIDDCPPSPATPLEAGHRNSDISTTPPDHANSNSDAWRVARAIEARHGYIPDTFDDLITGTNVTDKEKVHWHGRKGKGGHLENMKKQVVNERIGSGTWFSEFVEGEFSADMAQLAVTNFELMARWYKQVDEENGQHGETDEKKQERLGVAQLFRDAITRTQEHSQRAYDKAHLYAQTEFSSFPDNSNAASKTMLRRRIAEYARLMTEQLTPAFGPQHAFSNRREIEAAILLPYALRAHNVRMTFWKQRLTRSMLARWLRELRGVVDLKSLLADLNFQSIWTNRFCHMADTMVTEKLIPEMFLTRCQTRLNDVVLRSSITTFERKRQLGKYWRELDDLLGVDDKTWQSVPVLSRSGFKRPVANAIPNARPAQRLRLVELSFWSKRQETIPHGLSSNPSRPPI